MTVSIVMPCYNAAPWLARAISSCLNQTLPPLELIVVDDASTDSSPKVMEWAATTFPSVKVVRLPENGGPAAAMNAGIREAKGDIICFAAADDLQQAGKVQVLVESFEKGVDFCYTGYYHATVKGEIFEEVHPKPLNRENILANDCAAGEALAAKREVFLRIPFRENLRVNEDMAMLIDLYKAKLKYALVDIPTFRYRLLPSGISYSKKAEVDRITQELSTEL